MGGPPPDESVGSEIKRWMSPEIPSSGPRLGRRGGRAWAYTPTHRQKQVSTGVGGTLANGIIGVRTREIRQLPEETGTGSNLYSKLRDDPSGAALGRTGTKTRSRYRREGNEPREAVGSRAPRRSGGGPSGPVERGGPRAGGPGRSPVPQPVGAPTRRATRRLDRGGGYPHGDRPR